MKTFNGKTTDDLAKVYYSARQDFVGDPEETLEAGIEAVAAAVRAPLVSQLAEANNELDLSNESIGIARTLLEQAGVPSRAFFDDHVRAATEELTSLRSQLEVARDAFESIIEYWNGSNDSAVDACQEHISRASQALSLIPKESA